MGWGTNFKCNIYLSRITIDSQEQLKELIKDRELYLTDIKTKLLMFASANPKDLISEEWVEEPINFIHNSVNDLLREYDENYKELINFSHCLVNYTEKEDD